MITGINHLTLAVSDLERCIAFYTGLPGVSVRMRKPHSAYLEAGTLWLPLVVDRKVRKVHWPNIPTLPSPWPTPNCQPSGKD